jgi:rare lipoprotein A
MFEVLVLVMLSQQPLTPVAHGTASYYTVESSGSCTASGEQMHDGKLTCAMRTGEFGDYVLVVADNGKSVVCRINDRGPYVRGRVIDLSEAAMRKLSKKAGLLKVTVYSMSAKEVPKKLAEASPPTRRATSG